MSVLAPPVAPLVAPEGGDTGKLNAPNVVRPVLHLPFAVVATAFTAEIADGLGLSDPLAYINSTAHSRTVTDSAALADLPSGGARNSSFETYEATSKPKYWTQFVRGAGDATRGHTYTQVAALTHGGTALRFTVTNPTNTNNSFLAQSGDPNDGTKMPVVPGAQYTLSADLLVHQGTALLTARFDDVTGTYVSDILSTNITAAMGQGRRSLTFTAPATARFMRVGVQLTNPAHNDSFTVDALTVRPGTSTAYLADDNPDSVIIVYTERLEAVALTDSVERLAGGARTATEPLGLTDSALRSSTAAQTLSEALGLSDSLAVELRRTLTDGLGLVDDASLQYTHGRIVADGIGLSDVAFHGSFSRAAQHGPDVPVLPDQSYVWSAYGQTVATARKRALGIVWLDAAKNRIGTDSKRFDTLPPTSGWERYHISAKSPQTAKYARLLYGLASEQSPLPGEQHRWDSFQFEAGEIPAAYAPRPDEILPGAVGSSQLATGAVISGKISDGAVTGVHIGNGAVVAEKIAANAITADKVSANAITAGKIAANAVVAGTIAANAVTSNTIVAGAITSGKIAAGSISAADAVFNGAVIGTAQIIDAAIGSAKIQDAAIISAKIQDLAVVNAKVGDAQIDNAKIGGAQITAAKIGSVNAASIQAGTITARVYIESGRIATSAGFNKNRIEMLDAASYTQPNGQLANFDAIRGYTTTGSEAFIVTGSDGGTIQGPTLKLAANEVRLGYDAGTGYVTTSGNLFIPRYTGANVLNEGFRYLWRARATATFSASNFARVSVTFPNMVARQVVLATPSSGGSTLSNKGFTCSVEDSGPAGCTFLLRTHDDTNITGNVEIDYIVMGA